MHPILFRIPLPKTNVPAIYLYAAIIALGLIYAALQFLVWKDKVNAVIGVVFAAAGVVLKLTGFIENLAKDKDTPAGMIPIGVLPIYSYGVMLGLSLVVGWYLTLGLAKRDGLPPETMANNYVITAVAAIAGSRILYVLTNLNEFSSPIDIFALRRGGLVAYGGFLGGFLGSFFYLRRHKIPLLPWADVAVPSLASGLAITRIGCYLFGCDFGRPLTATAPEWLQKLGTFPRWEAGLLHEGQGYEGAPAFTQHVKNHLIDQSATASLPVHPTQLYEVLVGAGLLALLLYARTKQKFRGQIFILFTFAYGVARYLIEILRDDDERGSLPFSAGKHTMIALGLVIFAIGFSIGFSQLIRNMTLRRVAQALSFVPAVVAYFLLMPASYGESIPYQWSTSQFVGLTTGFAVCVAFSVLYKAALAHPEAAMRIRCRPKMKRIAPSTTTTTTTHRTTTMRTKAPPKKAPVKKAPAKKVAAKVESADDDEDEAADGEESAAKESAAKEPAPKPKAKVTAKPVKRTAVAKKPAPKPAPKVDEDDEAASDDKDDAPAKAAAKKQDDDDDDKAG